MDHPVSRSAHGHLQRCTAGPPTGEHQQHRRKQRGRQGIGRRGLSDCGNAHAQRLRNRLKDAGQAERAGADDQVAGRQQEEKRRQDLSDRGSWTGSPCCARSAGC